MWPFGFSRTAFMSVASQTVHHLPTHLPPLSVKANCFHLQQPAEESVNVSGRSLWTPALPGFCFSAMSLPF